MVQGISGNMPNVLAVLKNFADIFLNPGQIFEALVVSQEGEQYWLQVAGKMLPVRAETSLMIGQKLSLQVLGLQGEELLVKKLPLKVEDDYNKKEQLFLKMIKKYGSRGEKEVIAIKESLQKLPVDENTAVRYLLDPHLFTALLILKESADDCFDKIEVNTYKSSLGKDEIWEVIFELEMPLLGHLELKMKMLGKGLYMQIWAALTETENILRERKKELERFCPHVEIMAVENGPLVSVDYTKNIDLMV